MKSDALPRSVSTRERRETVADWVRAAGKKGITAPKIHARLREERGICTSIKTVQRDLNFLAACQVVQPAASQSESAPRWTAIAGARHALAEPAKPILSGAELKSARVALGIVTLFEQASHLLHQAALDDLREQYESSKALLTRVLPHEGRWLGKVVTGTQHLQLLQAPINSEILRAVQLALLGNYQLQVRYFAVTQQKENDYTIHPLGLSYQDSSIYLVCHFDGEEKIRCLPLHRFRSVKPLESRQTLIPKAFDIQNHIQRILVEPEFVNLKLRINNNLRRRLDATETPLAAEQKITPLGNEWHLLECQIQYTQGLEWWILSHGATVEVLEPASLRASVARSAATMASFYANQGETAQSQFS